MFHIHKWSKWEVSSEREIRKVPKRYPGEWQVGNPEPSIVGFAIIQKRVCSKCGKTEIDLQEVYV
jgi:hypothetical protein